MESSLPPNLTGSSNPDEVRGRSRKCLLRNLKRAGKRGSPLPHACSGAVSNAKPDCGEKRDPDKRSLIIQKKENELDPDTQLKKRTFATPSLSVHTADKTVVGVAAGGSLYN